MDMPGCTYVLLCSNEVYNDQDMGGLGQSSEGMAHSQQSLAASVGGGHPHGEEHSSAAPASNLVPSINQTGEIRYFLRFVFPYLLLMPIFILISFKCVHYFSLKTF